MGCRHYFVVDRLEDLFDEGGSRSSWRAHEHESFSLFHNCMWQSGCSEVDLVYHWTLWLAANNGSPLSVISSTFGLFTGTGWESIPLRSSLSRVSLSLDAVVVGEVDELDEDVGRLFLSWRCHWCWRMRTGGRTRSQAWNPDRNEGLRIALYSNPVFNEMWFSTVDPLIRISVFIAKLSERQDCWRVFEDCHSQEYIRIFDVHRGLFMRLHFSIGCYDCRRTTRLRQGIYFSRIRVLFCWLHASTRRSRQILDASRHLFSEGEKNVALFISFFFETLLVSLHAASRAPCSCHSLSSWGPILKFWSVGATLMRFTLAYQSERRILVSNVCVTCNGFLEFYTLDWFPYVWALP